MRQMMSSLLPAFFGLSACATEAETQVHQPVLDEVSSEADGLVDLIDRSEALTGATDDADGGEALDLSGSGRGFMLDIDSKSMQAVKDGAGAAEGAPPPAETYRNVVAGAAGLAFVDTGVALALAGPVAAIAFAVDGGVVELEPWLWSASNTLTGPAGNSVTADFTVAWVGVGWLAEMRLTSSDGSLADTPWFNGFVLYGGGLGWWDVYTAAGELAGVVEWIADGQGAAQFGIAFAAGDIAGDVVSYTLQDGVQGEVELWDESEGFLNNVLVREDGSGEATIISYAAGETRCWDADKADVDCDAVTP